MSPNPRLHRLLPLGFALALGLSSLEAQDFLYESGPLQLPPEGELTASQRIDQLVRDRLLELELAPAPLCSDAVFLRRAYLVTIGTLPTEDEARDFLATEDEAKRAVVIEHLLQRPEYADYWAMKWGDTLRVKAEFPIKLWPNAVQAYHHWIHQSLRDNKRYHHFVQELLVGNDEGHHMRTWKTYGLSVSPSSPPWSPAMRVWAAISASWVGYQWM